MNKGFGIAALVIAIIAIFIPIFGIIISGAALVLAAIAALAGDRAHAVATPLIAGVNTFFLSPSALPALSQDNGFLTLILVFLALPFIAIALNANGKVVLNKGR